MKRFNSRNPHFKRAFYQIQKSIEILDLDLSGKKVVTEVGSGNYQLTPFIPAIAGADQVIAWTSDSPYGSAEEIIRATQELMESYYPGNIVLRNTTFNKQDLRAADIVTNSGFIRPLDERKLNELRKGTAIPLMYEKWELRPTDISIDKCRELGIKVAGTWENHPDIAVFDHVGPLALKMAFEAGYEVFGNKVLVWSDDHFGEVISECFRNNGAKEVMMGINWDNIKHELNNIDFIFLADYDENRNYAEIFDFNYLQSLKSAPGIVHLYGELDLDRYEGLQISPPKNGKAMIMSRTLEYVGIRPLVLLQTAGFKVAQEMLAENLTNLSQPICNC